MLLPGLALVAVLSLLLCCLLIFLFVKPRLEHLMGTRLGHCMFLKPRLTQDPFGNYVVQYVLELGHPEAMAAIINHLFGHFADLAQQKFSSNVVEKCLKLGGPQLADLRERIIRELLNSPALPRLLQVLIVSLKWCRGRICLC